jgi:hypothetical protein
MSCRSKYRTEPTATPTASVVACFWRWLSACPAASSSRSSTLMTEMSFCRRSSQSPTRGLSGTMAEYGTGSGTFVTRSPVRTASATASVTRSHTGRLVGVLALPAADHLPPELLQAEVGQCRPCLVAAQVELLLGVPRRGPLPPDVANERARGDPTVRHGSRTCDETPGPQSALGIKDKGLATPVASPFSGGAGMTSPATEVLVFNDLRRRPFCLSDTLSDTSGPSLLASDTGVRQSVLTPPQS